MKLKLRGNSFFGTRLLVIDLMVNLSDKKNINFKVVIPARFNSSRLPGKVLLDIKGKSMIQRVYEQAIKSKANEVIIATDDERIASTAMKFGAEVCLTSSAHKSGTERLIEVVNKNKYDDNQVIVNVQGDEPLIPPEYINEVANLLINDECNDMATLQTEINDSEKLFDPNVVKVVSDSKKHAIYFSRAPIPWNRKLFNMNKVENLTIGNKYFQHIGIYAYRVKLLKKYQSWSVTDIEQIESLEQLRVIWYGVNILVGTVNANSCHIGIDTQEDLNKVCNHF